MRVKDDQLRDSLLDHARQIIDERSPQALNIRALAKVAGVATGTIYNYFNSKDEILLAVTALYWDETLLRFDELIEDIPFYRQVEQIFHHLSDHITESGAQLMHSLSNVRTTGQKRMQRTHREIQRRLVQLMKQDMAIDTSIWNEHFTQEDYAWFIIVNIMSSLRMGATELSFFVEIMKKTLYERQE